MGMLDALFGNDSGTGLLGGLPQSWQWQNPQYQGDSTKDFLEALKRGSAETADNTPVSQNPFGPVPQIAPPSVFGAVPQMGSGASMGSIGAALGMPGPIPGMFTPPSAPPPIQQPAQNPPPPAPAMSTTQNGPVNTMNVGGYQMPQFGSVADYTPTDSIPQNASPTQGQLPQIAQQHPQGMATPPAFLQPPSQGGFGGAFRGMAANAQGGPLGMLMGAIGGAAGMGRGNPQDIAQQNMRAQYESTRQALIANGIPERQANSTAMLSVLNPEAAKTVLPELLTAKTEIKMVKDALGAEHPYSWNSREQTFKPVGPDGEMSGNGGGGAPGGPGLLAPGVTNYNPSLSGEEYMAQFSPEVQAAAKSYINGDVMPTGNPRNQGITTLAKTVAQKYGMDTGTPVNDQTYAAKRKMQTDLASSGNSSMGGILSNGKSSFKHLAEYTESAADLGNASHNFPGGGIAAQTQNYIGNTLGGSDTRGKIKAISDNLGHYGQESTKFYAASGGGVEERTNALKQMNPATNSGEETAAYAEKEKNLMLDRFREKEAQIRDTMGEGYLQRHPVFTPELQKDIARIDASIAKMRGSSPSNLPTGWSVKVR